MATMKIKKGDTVKVITGKDKDKEGKVIAVNRKNNTLLVEGVNMVTKCTFTTENQPESVSRWTETKKYVLQNQQVM